MSSLSLTLSTVSMTQSKASEKLTQLTQEFNDLQLTVFYSVSAQLEKVHTIQQEILKNTDLLKSNETVYQTTRNNLEQRTQEINPSKQYYATCDGLETKIKELQQELHAAESALQDLRKSPPEKTLQEVQAVQGLYEKVIKSVEAKKREDSELFTSYCNLQQQAQILEQTLQAKADILQTFKRNTNNLLLLRGKNETGQTNDPKLILQNLNSAQDQHPKWGVCYHFALYRSKSGYAQEVAKNSTYGDKIYEAKTPVKDIQLALSRMRQQIIVETMALAVENENHDITKEYLDHLKSENFEFFEKLKIGFYRACKAHNDAIKPDPNNNNAQMININHPDFGFVGLCHQEGFSSPKTFKVNAITALKAHLEASWGGPFLKA